MTIVDIVQKGDNVLREKAEHVPVDSITSSHIQNVIEKMQKALATQADGVAIAAPQIGLSLQIFCIAPPAYQESAKERPLVFINPKITKLSKKKEWLPEGCLSIRWWFGEVYRSKQATIEAYNEHGIRFTLGASGLIAQIFQHEVDHLHGILFDDHARDLREMTENEITKAQAMPPEALSDFSS